MEEKVTLHIPVLPEALVDLIHTLLQRAISNRAEINIRIHANHHCQPVCTCKSEKGMKILQDGTHMATL